MTGLDGDILTDVPGTVYLVDGTFITLSHYH